MTTRIVVVGDELVAGHGDGRGLGWVGRVHVRTLPALPALHSYPLGIPDEGTSDLAARCMIEARRRFHPDADNRLVIALGHADLRSGLSLARSRLNLANVLDEALTAEVSTFVVGPPPSADHETNRRLAELSSGFSDVAVRRSIPFVDTFGPLSHHAVWQREVASSHDSMPSQEGHGLLSWLVLHRGWFEWLGVNDPQPSFAAQ